MARYVASSPAAHIELISIFFLLACSDCLAAPYSVTEDMNGAKEPVTVETCYKCKAPGHVRSSHLCSPRFSCVLTVRPVYRSLGIAPKDASRSWRKTIRGASLRAIPGVVMEHLRRPMGIRAH
jgi:hypothetical protein